MSTFIPDLAEDLYNQYKDYVYMLAYDMAKNHYDADDIVQQCFEKVICHADKFSNVSPEKHRAYLSAIAVNTSHDHLRKRNLVWPSGSIDHNVLFSDEIKTKETSMYLEQCLDELGKSNKKYREALFYRYYMGCSEREIAQLLHTSDNNCRVIVHRAKKKLRKIVEKNAAI